MSEEKSRSVAGKVILIILLALLAFILASVIYTFAILNGRAPVPKAAVTVLAEKAGLPEEERETLEKALNVYTILQSSDMSEKVTELRKSAMSGASEKEVALQVQEIYTALPEETLEEIREELEMTPEDFAEGKSIVDKAMAQFAETGDVRLSAEDEKALRTLAEKYGLGEESMGSLSGLR